MAFITLADLHFTYTGRRAETLAGVSMMFQEGETVLLLGASGSGKSTLALCLNGLIPHADLGRFAGMATVAGYETTSMPIARLSQQIGMVFQDPEAQLVMATVEEEVAFGLENLCVPAEEIKTRIDIALSQVGLLKLREAPVESLSGGYKQRLSLACALAMRPRILVFDEPTANLDPLGTRDVFAAIRDLKQTGLYTIILIEHKLDDVLDFIDRVVVLAAGGKILVEGDPRTVFTEHAELLTKEGIWMPQVALLAHRLHASGWTLEPFPLTHEEALAAWKHAPARTNSLSEVACSPVLPRTLLPISSVKQSVPAVEVRHLSFHVGEQRILEDISLRVPPGDFLALVGANGAGKTTLAYHLADIVHPARGSVFHYGADITTLSPRELLKRVGYVFQNPEHQFVAGSVEEELRFGLQQLHLPAWEIEQRVRRVLEQFALSRYAKANPFTLSHGEKRRLSVATMLLSDQQILILDEPTFGQDQRNARALLDLLQTLNRAGQTIVIITHDMALVAEYARHVAVLVQGQLRYHGQVAQLFAQANLLQEAHLGLPPIAKLAQQLAITDGPGFRHVLTVEQFLAQALTSGEVPAS
ncbi:ABC transporter ATP-binding protein [Ktedonosporobacter rubrisoli]|uniref:ABC transporter ATP-binding protein n=1 Tax=Ktedonosporobacter rubrisoli TaxID=2509675 RepID=A0A4P6JR99_KTERU|nr:ABC transporter ATP-binding protein [Ktedonosporobacter rubrisoli]QBD77885.1 ABC transporter ATP-binding protein [Ktedonosporobacter rubrisoli]